MGFSRKSTAPAREVRDNLSQGVSHLKNAGVAAAKGTRDAAGPRVEVMLTKVGIRKKQAAKWPWVAGAISVGVAAGGALAYLIYRRRTESMGEALLADELLDETEEPSRDDPRLQDPQLGEELVDSVTR
ncbi:hypothetical protein [Glycomyces salinus]|uniref:hypothetical protein n=1 Tax=Glycomyces salinus TaxID=980294 RepID=UPI0018EC101A|nr:hypothetical protein [Glycomyces salinus]